MLGVAAVLLVVGAVAGDPAGDPGRAIDAGAAGILVTAGLAVAAAGRFPVGAAVAALALTFLWYGVDYRSGLINVFTMAAFYRLGATAEQRPKVTVTTGAVLATGMMMLGLGDEGWSATAQAAGYLVVAVLFGELLRSRRLLVEQYAERAARAEADAERRLVEERLSIARDVHDVLAHTVSVMSVQAAVAADSLGRDDHRTAGALAAIRREGRRAMEEVRAIVSVLRTGPGGDQPSAPAPRLGDLTALADAARAHGLGVDVCLDVPAGRLPELVELTSYRVVQEALTNVTRHAVDATCATVTVRLDGDDWVVVEVVDDGNVRGPVQPGFGLRGMAERVEAIGGRLHHGAAHDSGFVVRATLPLPRS